MEITKSAFCGPITAIETVSFQDNSYQTSFLIICSQGPYLLIYTTSNAKGTLIHVLEPLMMDSLPTSRGSQNISGLSILSNHNIAVYGGKRAQIIHFHNEFPEFSSETLLRLGPLADLILDVQEIIQELNHLILIGYAQNYIDIINLTSGAVLYTIKSTIACVLFSMSIYTSNDSRLSFDLSSNSNSSINFDSDSEPFIASGTAFGKIILWPISNLTANTAHPPSAVLEGHTGVIFRMKLTNHSGQRLLASVSDDRSVRVWNISSFVNPFCLFIGWGHICRVWDVQFLANGLVTCSEDSTIKIWELDFSSHTITPGRCVSTLSGHGKNVWRIALLKPFPNYDVENIVVSAGNDGALKFWPIDCHSVLSQKIDSTSTTLDSSSSPSPSPSRAFKCESLIPETCRTSPLISHGNRRMNCAAGISVSPTGSSCIIILLDGTTWIAEMTPDDGIRWINVNLESVQEQESQFGITGVSVIWSELIAISMIKSNGFVQFSLIRYNVHDTDHQSSVVEVMCSISWEAHQGKGINTWILKKNSLNENILTYDVLTCSVGGHCSVFKILMNSHSSQDEIQLTSAAEGIVPTYCSHHSNYTIHVSDHKGITTITNCIATTASMTSAHNHQFLVIGDCRGNLSIFDFDSIYHQNETPATLCYLRAHGLEVVSYIRELESRNIENIAGCTGFCTLGLDGCLNIYTLDQHNHEFRVRIIFRLSCIPIAAPDQFFVCGQGSEISFYVGGFQSSEYIIWDIRRKYQLLRTEAGSWKRPHCAIVQATEFSPLPSITFVSLSPTNNNTKLICLRYVEKYNSRQIHYPLHLGVPANGKVSYAAAFIPIGKEATSQFVVIGGEDGNVKLFKHDPSTSFFQFIQEVQMPMHAAVKAISHSPSPNNSKDLAKGIVVAAGGKLSYSVWAYDLTLHENIVQNWPIMWCILQPLCSSMMQTPTRKRNNSKRKAKEGKNQRIKVESNSVANVDDPVVDPQNNDQEEENMQVSSESSPVPIPVPVVKLQSASSEDQDHRIMSVSTSPCHLNSSQADSNDNYVALLGDSKGLATLLLINSTQIIERNYQRSSNKANSNDDSSGPLGAFVLEEFHPSEYPLLSNTLISIPIPEIAQTFSSSSQSTLGGSLQMAAFGDTTGEVSLWCMSSSSLFGREMIPSSVCLFSYAPHSMGTNCLSCHLFPDQTTIQFTNHNNLHHANNNSDNNTNAGPELEVKYSVGIASGGDDQRIGLGIFTIQATFNLTQKTSLFRLVSTALHSISSASGSALKGVNFFTKDVDQSLGLCSVGYDQRLSVWGIKLPLLRNDCGEDDVEEGKERKILRTTAGEPSCPLVWLTGSLVNIGDVNSMTLSQSKEEDRKRSVLVVGEGFQLFELR